jgi:hypothetical protein
LFFVVHRSSASFPALDGTGQRQDALPFAPAAARSGVIPKEGGMDTPPKAVGSAMRRLFAAFAQRPMNWNLIDAFTRLEEREEELRDEERQRRGGKPDEPSERS